MTIQGISNNVDELLKASDIFVDVDDSPQEGEQVNYGGFPSVSHYYSGTASDYATNTQNRRSISYTVEAVIVPVSFSKAYELTDQLLDIFDKSIDLSSTELGLTRACDILQPVPGEIMKVSTNHGEGLLVTITLVCTADVSNR